MGENYAWEIIKDGDKREEFDRLFSEFVRLGGSVSGGAPDIRTIGGCTVIILDNGNDAFVEYLRSHGWEARRVGPDAAGTEPDNRDY